MAAYTLERAREMLTVWMEAEKAVATAQHYRIGTRELTRANLGEIRERIRYWETKVAELEAVDKNGGGRRVTRIVPRDL